MAKVASVALARLRRTPRWTLVAFTAKCLDRASELLDHPYLRRYKTPERLRLIKDCQDYCKTASESGTANILTGKRLAKAARLSSVDCLDVDSDLVALGGEDHESYSVMNCAKSAVLAAVVAELGDDKRLLAAVINACRAAEEAPTSNAGRDQIVLGLRQDFDALAENPNMAIISDFVDSVKGIILWGVKANKTSRAEMRETVMVLYQELNDAIFLVVIYLQRARGIEDDGQLAEHLTGLRSKLLRFCKEFHICGSLYELCDRFDRLFDPMSKSIEVGEGENIRRLLNSLRDRERSILDHISDTLYLLEGKAADLRNGRVEARVEIMELIVETIDKLKKAQKSIKNASRKIVDTM